MTRLRAVLLAIAVFAALSGCGGSSSDLTALSAKAIFAKARAQAETEPYVSLVTRPADSGDDVEFSLHYSGKDSYSTIGLDGGVATLLKVDGLRYFKFDDTIWKAREGDKSATIIAYLKGRWIRAADNSRFPDTFLRIADRSYLIKTAFPAEGATATKGGSKKIDGVDCVALDGEDGGSLYVAIENARPMQFAFGSKSDGDWTFSYKSFDVPTAPAAADVIDESELFGST